MPYQEKDVSEDSVAAYEMVRRSGQQGVPVITVDENVVVGFDQRRLEFLISQETKGPTLGAAVADAARILMKQGQVPVFGAYVGKVAPGSPAAKLGLRPGDVITQFNVRPVRNAADVEQAMSGMERGAALSVTFVRGDATLEAKTTV